MVDFFFMPAAAGLVAEDIARPFPLPFNERVVEKGSTQKKKSCDNFLSVKRCPMQ